MKPTAIKALKLAYVLGFLPLLLVEGYLCSWILSTPNPSVMAVSASQFMFRIVIYCTVSFLFGVYLGVPHISRRIRAKKTQFSFIYLLGFIILLFLTVMLFPNPWGMHAQASIFGYVFNWFFIGSYRFMIPLPLGLISSGFFLAKAF